MDLNKRIWDQQQQQGETYYCKLTNYISHQSVNINISKLEQLKLLQALTENYLGTGQSKLRPWGKDGMLITILQIISVPKINFEIVSHIEDSKQVFFFLFLQMEHLSKKDNSIYYKIRYKPIFGSVNLIFRKFIETQLSFKFSIPSSRIPWKNK